ncbi:apolipoprotein D and lipocalin family protein [Pedobacter sp. UYP24]
MKVIAILMFMVLTNVPTTKNIPVPSVDLKKYAGTWYSLYSIPTPFDKGSRETTTHYKLNDEGYFNVLTTYKKTGSEEVHNYKSKIFPDEDGHGSSLKAQFIWPIKIAYWIIDIADDYSYVVVGHPDHKFLFIMSRSNKLPKKTYEEILQRCKAKGYDISKLTSQQHS